MLIGETFIIKFSGIPGAQSLEISHFCTWNYTEIG